MNDILITGANGCIGSALVKNLMEADYKITALALNSFDINHIDNIKGIKIVYGDICDIKKVEEIISLNRFNAVIHLAAIVHEHNASENDFERVNHKATITLFELSKKYKVQQFIFVSTVAVYGEETERALDEKSPCNPQTPYAVSKLKAEEYIRKNCNQTINYTIIRPATVYGEYDKGNIARLFGIAKKRVVPLIGDGNNLKSFVYVENLVGGIVSTVLNTAAYNQVFILSDNESYSVNRILREMEKVIGRKIIVIHLPLKIIFFFLRIINYLSSISFKKELFKTSSIKGLVTNNTFDISKATKILNYTPRYTLSAGLKKIYGA
jgi:nucleoside-diphosphate-sugar epimerase